jgi:thioredoxin 1
MIIPDNGPVVLKFYRKDCPPCKALSPITKEIASENPEVQFLGINTREDIETAKDYDIRSVPTLVFVKDGIEVARLVGSQSKKVIEENVFLLLE